MTSSESNGVNNTPMVLGVLFLLIILLVLLFILYKWLNHQTNDQYTVNKYVYKEGGLRDRVMHGIEVVQSRLHAFLQLSQTHEDDESCVEGGNGAEEEEEEEAEQSHDENESKTKDEDDMSNDHSSTDLKEGERQILINKEEKQHEEPEKVEVEKGTEKKDESDLEGDVKKEDRVGLLVDLNTFSGSAIWSEEEKNDDNNVTAL